jgi:SHS2 domain-containing protein
MQSGFTILDHPADIGIEARGSSLGGAFAQAAIALMSIILDLSTVESVTIRSVEVEAADPSQLLVRWLTEILFLYDGKGFVTREVTIRQFTPTCIAADLHGDLLDPSRHRTRLDVKAITYHQLEVIEGPDGGLVRVYLDI